MIAAILASSVDGQRIDLAAIVASSGPQSTSKAGTAKRNLVLTDPSGTIELTLLCEGATAQLTRGDAVALKSAKVGVWNGKVSLLMFAPPLVQEDPSLRAWWVESDKTRTPSSVRTILNLPDQHVIHNFIGLIVSTEEASATKSGGTKRKFTIADESTTAAIEVCFAGKHAAAKPNYNVGSIVIIATAKVGVWQDTRSLIIFDAPTCVAEDHIAAKGIQSWIRTGGANIHRPLSLTEMIRMSSSADDQQRIDLLPVVVSAISERTMTKGGSMWKRTIEVADQTTNGAGVEICAIGAAADAKLHIGDVIGIKRAKACTYNGKRGAVVFEAPGRVEDDKQMKAWWAGTNSANSANSANSTNSANSANSAIVATGKNVPADNETKLGHIPTMADGTHVRFAAVVLVDDHTVTDALGLTVGATFNTLEPLEPLEPLSGRIIRIDDAIVTDGALVVSSFTDLPNDPLAAWWEHHKQDNLTLTHAKDAPPPVAEWPF
jgi:hypothetical protein